MKRREHIYPDLTPLIDVVFLLLIFFLVSSVFKKDELALMLDLPDVGSKKIEIEEKDLTIELNDKDVAFKGKKMSFVEFETAIKEFQDTKKQLNIRIDKNVNYERVAKLLNILQTNGFYNLALPIELEK
ncbi:MAG: biopolymer transporter ExbD [Campylobacterales bacterium]|nr:biopolymer transporter ExbD [Campylobacterales bacterium]